MSQDHYAVRNRDLIFNDDPILQIQKQFAAEITIVPDLEFLIVASPLTFAVVNNQRGSKMHTLTNRCPISSQCWRNYLRGHEHQRNVDAFAAVGCRASPRPHSKEEIQNAQTSDRLRLIKNPSAAQLQFTRQPLACVLRHQQPKG